MSLLNIKMARYLSMVGLAVLNIGQAEAVIVVGSGVDLIDTKHYVINTDQSNLNYSQGFIVFGAEQNAENYDLAGTFDTVIKRFWWDYYLDGDAEGSQGTFTYETNWLEFVNPSLNSGGLPSDFSFPSFPNFMSSDTEFFGSSGPCALPFGPNTSCSGSSLGESSLSGYFRANKIFIEGSQPDSVFPFSGYQYHIEATVVPVPAAFWLFISGLSVLAIRHRS